MSSKQKFCRNCGTPLPAGVKVCAACGAKAKKPLFARWWFILLVVIAVLTAVGQVRHYLAEQGDPIRWTDIRLGERLPELASVRGEVHTNTETDLDVEVFKTSQEQYNSYVDACREKGFSIDDVEDGSAYSAYDTAGYALRLILFESSKKMNIRLTAPMEMGPFQWPAGELGALIPAPPSTVGNVSWERSDGFFLYVGQMPRESYDAYVTACADSGFAVDYDKGEDYYHAEDGAGHRLSLKYEGNDTVSIRLEQITQTPKPAEEVSVETEAPAATEQPEAGPEASSGIDPEFKQAMDSYEAFFDEYIEFMQSYQQNGSPLDMLTKYASYMSQYAETMKAMEGLGEQEMSNEELLYYTEVTSRINQKLMAAALETE